jgi:nucleoside transporter
MTTIAMSDDHDDQQQTPLKIRVKLSIMMFLQYAIWGAWLPLMFPYFNEFRSFSASDIGYIAAVGAIGALVAPFIAGQFADRYFNTERFLGVSHLIGAVLIWVMADVTTFYPLMLLSFLYALLYTPTLALTNSLAFHHLRDRDREFGKVRVWGTIGWIVVGIGIGQYLLYKHTPNLPDPAAVHAAQVSGMAIAFRASAVLGIVLGAFCFLLPKTPPKAKALDDSKRAFAPGEALGEILRSRALLVLFIVSFPIACVHQFYFVRTAGFLGSPQLGLGSAASSINRIFGVGGGGMMTIGQISELVVLALMPFIAKSVSKKILLCAGVLAYVLRFFAFAYLPYAGAVVPALALHGICFGCFFFIAFILVDELTTKDVRASAQNLFNLIIVGLGVIVGNLFAGQVDRWAQIPGEKAGTVDYRVFFSIPMAISIACLIALLIAYPNRGAKREQPAALEPVQA